MNNLDKFIDAILNAIDARLARRTTPTVTQAKVLRVDGDTVWVHIPGGAPETPVKKTIACRTGDTVQVRVSTPSIIIGNNTAPPTDDTEANKAKTEANEARRVATKAQEETRSTKQYFWSLDGDSPEAGAHVTEVPMESFIKNPHGGNLLMRSNSVRIRLGAKILSELSENRMTLASGKAVVKYSEDGSAFGLQDSHRIVVCKGTDEAGVRNDATLSSRDVANFDMQTMPMAFFNATHKVENGDKSAAAGLYVFDGSGHFSYMVLGEGPLSPDGFIIYTSKGYFTISDWVDLNQIVGQHTTGIAALQDAVDELTSYVHQVATGHVGSYVSLDNTYKKLPMVSDTDVGARIEFYDGGIRCTAAGNVIVSGQVQFADINDTNICTAQIRNGTTTVVAGAATCASNSSTNNRQMVCITPKLISVSAGDVLYMYVSNRSGAHGQAGATGTSVTDDDMAKNYLTIEYV